MVSLWEYNDKNDFKQSFISFWNMLKPLYDKLKESLLSNGVMFEGGIYRKLAENEDIIASKFKDKNEKIVFVGLFHMSKAQMEILKHLKKYCDVDFCWDENAKILEDESSLAFRIMQDNKNTLGYIDDANWNKKVNISPEITVVACSGKISEAKSINLLIEEMGKPMDNSKEINSAIILADESILIPMVSSIPQEITDINISIGYPLRNSNISIIINRWIRLLSYNTNNSKELQFRTSDIIGFFNYPLIYSSDKGATFLVEEIKNYNRYISTSKLLSDINDSISERSIILDILLNHNNSNPSGLLENIIALLNILVENTITKDEDRLDDSCISTFELEFMFHYIKMVNRLKSLIDSNMEIFAKTDTHTNVYIVTKLLESIVNNKFIPFEGDPLKGIQIIGLVESRCLDFENIIILSTLDSTVSSDKGNNSIIPQVIRRGFGLPCSEVIDAVDAYRFYRLIGKAKKIIFSYNQNSDSISGSEPSRFINQLKFLHNFEIKHKTLYSNTKTKKQIQIGISDFDDDIQKAMDRFKEHNDSYLSASAINTLVRCPICFYYDYIKRLKRDEDPYMILKENEFGDILHRSMKDLLEPYENGKRLDVNVFNNFLDDTYTIKKMVQKAYCQILDIDVSKDYNALDNMYIDMCSEYVKMIFEYDKSLLDKYEIYYLFGEKKLRGPITIGSLKLNFTGSVDRIDLIKDKNNGNLYIRVIDYKTGKYDLKTKWTNFFNNKNHPKAIFQTLLYSEMILQHYDTVFEGIELVKNKNIKIIPCIYGTKDLSSNKDNANTNVIIDKTPIYDYDSIKQEFMDNFREYISEYFTDSKKKFDENMANSAECHYCPISIHK